MARDMVVPLHVAALACYLAAAVAAFAPFWGLPKVSPLAGTFALVVGTVLHAGALAAYTRAYGMLPLAGFAPALSALTFVLAVAAAATQLSRAGTTMKLVVAPLLVASLTLATLLGFGAAVVPEQVRGAWFVLHVTLSFVGLAMLVMAFAASALYLVEHRELKSRKFGAVFQFFPALEQLDRVNHRTLVAGFLAVTIGTVLALGYTLEYPSSMAVDRAKIIWGVLTWLVLGVAVWLRVGRAWHGPRAARATVVGFSVVVLVFVVLKLAFPSPLRFL